MHKQLIYPGSALDRSDSSAMLVLATVFAIGLHLALWGITFELPQQAPQQRSMDVNLIEMPSAAEATAPVTQEIAQQPSPIPTQAEQERAVPRPEQPAEKSLITAVRSEVTVPEKLPAEPELPTGADLFREGLASSQNFIPQATLAPGELRKKYISASTTDWLYSSYMNAWTQKVERVGNMNYPDEARRQNLRGDLVMSVGIRADGSLESIEVLRESGFPILDEAAIRIVELSAPYSVLPEQIAKEVDVLYITRTWRFSPDRGSFN